MREAAKKTSLLAVLLLACACATPIGVTHVNTQSMYRSVTSSVLSAGQPSQYSEQLLTRLGLGERFDTDPELALAALRGPGEGLSREYLFVLSELSFYHAVKSQKPEYFLASAVYAWAFVRARRTRCASTRSTPAFGSLPTSTIWGWPRGLPVPRRRRSCSRRARGVFRSAGSRSAWMRACCSGPAIA
jgi:hypothetical protein